MALQVGKLAKTVMRIFTEMIVAKGGTLSPLPSTGVPDSTYLNREANHIHCSISNGLGFRV